MRTFLITLCVIAFVAAAAAMGLSDEQMETLKKNHTECMSDAGVDEAIINKSRNFGEGDSSIEDEPLKRYEFCMLRKSDLITEDGHFNKDVCMTKLPEVDDREEVEKAIDACSDEQGDTPYETAWLTVKCFKEKYFDYTLI